MFLWGRMTDPGKGGGIRGRGTNLAAIHKNLHICTVIRTWLRRYLGVIDADVPVVRGVDQSLADHDALRQVQAAVRDLETQQDWLYHQLKKLRGRITGAIRTEMGPGDDSRDDRPGNGTGHQMSAAELQASILARRRGNVSISR